MGLFEKFLGESPEMLLKRFFCYIPEGFMEEYFKKVLEKFLKTTEKKPKAKKITGVIIERFLEGFFTSFLRGSIAFVGSQNSFLVLFTVS